MSIKFNCNPDGELIDPSLHDSEITKLSFERAHLNKNVVINLRTERGENFELRLVDVRDFILRGPSVQNIVREILILQQDSLREVIRDYLSDFGEHFSEFYEIAMNSDDMQLVHLMPSTGFELIVTCKKVELSLLR